MVQNRQFERKQAALRRWLVASVLCAIAVVVSIAYVDRPVAEFFEARLRHTEYWVWLSRALRPLDLVVVIALFFPLACGFWVGSGRELPRWTQAPLLCSWSAIWAVAADIVLKRVFGRQWPDPDYVRSHLFGFHLLRGGAHWGSFPSGTAAISTSIASVLWIVVPRSRLFCALTVVLLSGAVVAGNYHWVSDVIAGAFLGTCFGSSTARLLHPFASRPVTLAGPG
jgi:membrane-associated phospholipid phosphatase